MERTRRGGVVFPLILIGLGVVFLLNNLGVLSWSVWDVILRLWPVLLIGVGLDILLGGRSPWASLLVVVLVVAIAGSLVYLALPTMTRGATGEPIAISQPLEGAPRADVRIGFGTGQLDLGALGESGNLIEGTVQVDAQERVTPDFHRSGDTAFYRLSSQATTFGWFPIRSSSERTWTLKLNRDVPMKLRLDSGVGRSEVDLSATHVNDLEVHSGVGEVVLTLPRQGQVQARLDGGVGNVIVQVPEGMALRLRVSGGIGGVDVTGDFRRDGDIYTSAGYDTASDRTEMRVNGGVGRVKVQRLRSG